MSSSYREITRYLLVAAIGAVIASVFFTTLASQPSLFDPNSRSGGGGSSIALPPENPSTVKICNALHALRKMHPDSPSLVLDPLELLGLSTTDAALRDAGKASSAKVGSRTKRLLQKAVLDGGNHVRAPLWAGARASRHKKRNDGTNEGNHNDDGDDDDEDGADGLVRRTIRASYVVSDMLLDDAARIEFLKRLQPKLGEKGAVSLKARLEAVDRFCARAWKSRGW